MSEYEAPPASAPRKSGMPMAAIAVVLLVGVAVLAWVGRNHLPGMPGGGGAIKHVGALDQEVIFNLPPFQDAKKQLEEKVKKSEESFKAKVKAAQASGKMSQADEASLQREAQEMKLQLQQESNKMLNPLKLRAEYAVSQVARSKDMTVVLDKRIIVYGVPDITEDVKKAFDTAKETDKVKDDPNAATAPIGYFDQEVVRTLKVFQEAELKIYQNRASLAKEFDEKTKNMKPADKELLERQYKLKAEAFQEQTMTPLVQAVNESVKEVAQAEGLSLVLDKQHVMQGGRNMTDKVVETFLKKVGGAPGEAATPGASTPTPAAETPAGGK